MHEATRVPLAFHLDHARPTVPVRTIAQVRWLVTEMRYYQSLAVGRFPDGGAFGNGYVFPVQRESYGLGGIQHGLPILPSHRAVDSRNARFVISSIIRAYISGTASQTSLANDFRRRLRNHVKPPYLPETANVSATYHPGRSHFHEGHVSRGFPYDSRMKHARITAWANDDLRADGGNTPGLRPPMVMNPIGAPNTSFHVQTDRQPGRDAEYGRTPARPASWLPPPGQDQFTHRVEKWCLRLQGVSVDGAVFGNRIA